MLVSLPQAWLEDGVLQRCTGACGWEGVCRVCLGHLQWQLGTVQPLVIHKTFL